MSEFFDRLRNNEYKNIVILSGAGVSTNSGVCDYRSREGMFNKLAEVYPNIKDPSDLFMRSFVNANPQILRHPVYLEFLQQIADAKPTIAHELAAHLHKKGILKRVITQNIDQLYNKVNIPKEKIVEFHGTIINPVLYGDGIPAKALKVVQEDFGANSDVDCVIIMGTSMKVAPFNTIPNMVKKGTTRVIVNNEIMTCTSALVDKKGQVYVFQKDCDKWAKKTIKVLNE